MRPVYCIVCLVLLGSSWTALVCGFGVLQQRGLHSGLIWLLRMRVLQVRHGRLPAQGERWLEDSYLGQGLLCVGAQQPQQEVVSRAASSQC